MSDNGTPADLGRRKKTSMVSDDTARTLIVRNWNAGFFSNFNGVLNNLDHHLGRNGVEAAVVDWRADPGLPEFGYGQGNDGNLWLHYFEPLPFESFPAKRLEVRTFARFGITGVHAYATYRLGRRWRSTYHSLFRRYIRIKPALLERVETLCHAAMSGRYCVGVHYRHPAHAGECPDPMPPVDAFIDRLRQLVPKDLPWSIVIASDIEPAVASFREAFGDKLVVQPGVSRTSDLSHDGMLIANRSPSTLLGEQVLIDCLLLARCHALLHVTSNVATAAAYINPNLKMVYCETEEQEATNLQRLLALVPRTPSRP